MTRSRRLMNGFETSRSHWLHLLLWKLETLRNGTGGVDIGGDDGDDDGCCEGGDGDYGGDERLSWRFEGSGEGIGIAKWGAV